jgi:hypothetical protein|tara:strand:+ start:3993 stop:4181 length:189 start_codon:yes stop_codon:yes gene_type:complete
MEKETKYVYWFRYRAAYEDEWGPNVSVIANCKVIAWVKLIKQFDDKQIDVMCIEYLGSFEKI